MIRLLLIPLVMALVTAWLTSRFNIAKSRQELAAMSAPLDHPVLEMQTQRLAQALDLPRIPVMELKRDEVNGMADVDGRVYLTSGFLRKYREGQVSAEELASVIAHELGHVAQGHAKKRMNEALGHQTALMMANMMLARFVPFVGPWLVARIATALMARTSREHEFQADEWASALLIKAGIGTAPQKSLFRKLGTLTGGAGDGIPAWMRSHPTAADRVAAIEKNEARWTGKPALPVR
jgi:putative metalloprotease